MRLIDADALERVLDELSALMARRAETEDAGFRAVGAGVTLAQAELDAAPTIDPVRHARWARKDNSKNCKRVGDFEEWYECSACEGNAGDKSAYCPACGAKMDLEVPNE